MEVVWLLLLLLLLLLIMLLLLLLLLLTTTLPTLTPGMTSPTLAGISRTCARGSLATGSAVGFADATAPSCCVCGGVVADETTPVAAGACRRTSTATESASRSQLAVSPSACPVKS